MAAARCPVGVCRAGRGLRSVHHPGSGVPLTLFLWNPFFPLSLPLDQNEQRTSGAGGRVKPTHLTWARNGPKTEGSQAAWGACCGGLLPCTCRKCQPGSNPPGLLGGGRPGLWLRQQSHGGQQGSGAQPIRPSVYAVPGDAPPAPGRGHHQSVIEMPTGCAEATWAQSTLGCQPPRHPPTCFSHAMTWGWAPWQLGVKITPSWSHPAPRQLCYVERMSGT